jgi:ABC-type transport system involved in cytochrome c biogenesis permease subunit
MFAPPPRRRRNPLPMFFLLLLVALVAFLVWLSMMDTEVATQRIEEDVTNAALAK